MKECSKCNQMLPLDAFSPTSGGNYLRPECRQCNYELTKVRNQLRKETPPPPEDHTCHICGKSEEHVRGLGGKRLGPWCLDHCHQTESFRGWLCHRCNRALGGFNDDIETLQRAIEYLRGSHEAH